MKKNDLGLDNPKTGESFGMAFFVILALVVAALLIFGAIKLFFYAPLFVGIIVGAGTIWVALAMALKYTPWGRWFMYGETDAKRAADKAAAEQKEQDKYNYPELNYPYGVRR